MINVVLLSSEFYSRYNGSCVTKARLKEFDLLTHGIFLIIRVTVCESFVMKCFVEQISLEDMFLRRYFK